MRSRVAWLTLLLGMAPALALADAKAGEKKAQLCRICHRADNPPAYIPTLEGQTREYLFNQIKAYKDNRRPDPTMQTNVASLSVKDIRDIADYFASQTPLRGAFPFDEAKAGRGKARAAALKCAACHREDYSGNKEVPRLAGLEPRYIGPQLVAIAAGNRAHPAFESVQRLSPGDAEELAQYFATLQ
jgi:cytochrome c553